MVDKITHTAKKVEQAGPVSREREMWTTVTGRGCVDEGRGEEG